MYNGVRCNTGVSEASLRKYVPSLFAEGPHESRSAQYEFIPTWDVLKALQAKSFVIVSAQGAKVKDEGRRDYCKHLVRMRAPNDDHMQVGDTRFEVVLRNAHDGTGSYSLMAGLFKLICANGMTVGEHFLPPVSVQHRGRVSESVIAASFGIVEQAPRVMGTVERWRQLQLTPVEQGDFAAEALKIRFDVDSYSKAPITPRQLLLARRFEDQKNDLWTVFNRVQENIIQGGMEGRSSYRGQPATRAVRAVKGIDQGLRVNKQLWDLGVSMAERKGAA